MCFFQLLFEIEVFCNNLKVFTVTFNHLWFCLITVLNSFHKILLTTKRWTDVYYYYNIPQAWIAYCIPNVSAYTETDWPPLLRSLMYRYILYMFNRHTIKHYHQGKGKRFSNSSKSLTFTSWYNLTRSGRDSGRNRRS